MTRAERDAFMASYIDSLPEPHRKGLRAALDDGWRLETDWRKIRARYQNLDLAGKVPRNIIYCDLGVLIGRLVRYEALLAQRGWRVVEEEDE